VLSEREGRGPSCLAWTVVFHLHLPPRHCDLLNFFFFENLKERKVKGNIYLRAGVKAWAAEWSVFSVRAVKKINLHHQFITDLGRKAGWEICYLPFDFLWTALPKRSLRGLTHRFGEGKGNGKRKWCLWWRANWYFADILSRRFDGWGKISWKFPIQLHLFLTNTNICARIIEFANLCMILAFSDSGKLSVVFGGNFDYERYLKGRGLADCKSYI
jgi:hypothetical protein